MTTAPTPLRDLTQLAHNYVVDGSDKEYQRLYDFLQSPAVMALSDPKLRAAAEVVIGRLPDLLGMEAKEAEHE